MKVLCIKQIPEKFGPIKPCDMIYVGEEYTVVCTCQMGRGTYYQLAEKDECGLYSDSLFAPLSDIDETTFQRDYSKISHYKK